MEICKKHRLENIKGDKVLKIININNVEAVYLHHYLGNWFAIIPPEAIERIVFKDKYNFTYDVYLNNKAYLSCKSISFYNPKEMKGFEIFAVKKETE